MNYFIILDIFIIFKNVFSILRRGLTLNIFNIKLID